MEAGIQLAWEPSNDQAADLQEIDQEEERVILPSVASAERDLPAWFSMEA